MRHLLRLVPPLAQALGEASEGGRGLLSQRMAALGGLQAFGLGEGPFELQADACID
ncbi:MAG: hypothetical protein AAFU49_24485 [Pseudomonadota bacterium]